MNKLETVGMHSGCLAIQNTEMRTALTEGTTWDFSSIRVLIWMDSPFCVEYNSDKMFQVKILTTGQVMIIYIMYLSSLLPFLE